jgi:hypothetical protein
MKAQTPTPPVLPPTLIDSAKHNRVPAFGSVATLAVGSRAFFFVRDAAKNNIHKDDADKAVVFEGKASTETEIVMLTEEGWKSPITQAQLDQVVAAKSNVLVMFTPTEILIFNLPGNEPYFFGRLPARQ